MQSLHNKIFSLLILSGLSTLPAMCEQSSVLKILHDALQAQGGEQKLRAVRNVQWTLAGYRDEVEESERPEGPYVIEFDSTKEVHDFQHGRYLSLTDASVYPVFTFTRGSLATNDVAVRIMNGKKVAGSPEQLRVAHERLALSPERILLTALDASDVHLEPDTVLQSVPQNVAVFSLDGAPVRVFLNAYTHLPTAVDYSGPMAHTGFWAYLGDVTSRTWYSFWWLAKGGIRLPMQWNIEGNGLRDQMVVVKTLLLNAELKEEDFAIPDDLRVQYLPLAKSTSPEDIPLGTPSEPAIEVRPGIIFIPGRWNVTLVRQEDGIVVLEAPISSGYSAKVIAEAHRHFPGQIIKAVITTSDSWPHLAGVRQFVAEGIPIYALDLN